MSAKVLVLGLDAADITLIERWAAAGDLPTFAELSRRSAMFGLGNPLDTLPEAVWDELHTGRDAGKIGRYYALSQVTPAKPRPGPTMPRRSTPATTIGPVRAAPATGSRRSIRFIQCARRT
jgi:hypothetical protein